MKINTADKLSDIGIEIPNERLHGKLILDNGSADVFAVSAFIIEAVLAITLIIFLVGEFTGRW